MRLANLVNLAILLTIPGGNTDERNIHPRRKRFWKAQYSDSKTEFDHRFPSSAFDTNLNKPQTLNFDENDQSYLVFEENQRPRYVPGYPEEIPYLSEWSSNIDVDNSLLDDFREYEYLPTLHDAGKYSTKTADVDYEFTDNIDKRREHQAIDATIEVLLVIDNAIYRKFLKSSKYQSSVASTKLQQYYSIVIAMVDQRYQTVKETDISLRVKISGMYIAKTRMQASWIEYLVRYSDHVKQGSVNASRALRRFQKWLRSTKNLPSFDHAILITGYSLSKNNANVDGIIAKAKDLYKSGLAYVGTICKTADGKSSSIVHDEGDFQSVGVISHELGHSLGATHDGDDENIDCPANGNYIMAPQNTNDIKNAANLHHFSRCSIRQLRKVLLTSQAECLHNAANEYISYDMQKRPPGTIFSADLQCKMAFGRQSSYCEEGEFGSAICKRLWCTDPSYPLMCRTSSRLVALPGTTCAADKVCNLGECISVADTVPSNALIGGGNTYTLSSCSDDSNSRSYCDIIVKASPFLCSKDRIRLMCCQSCEKVQ